MKGIQIQLKIRAILTSWLQKLFARYFLYPFLGGRDAFYAWQQNLTPGDFSPHRSAELAASPPSLGGGIM